MDFFFFFSFAAMVVVLFRTGRGEEEEEEEERVSRRALQLLNLRQREGNSRIPERECAAGEKER